MNKNELSYDLKYRPDSFDDVLGQESVIDSLENYFASKKSFPHAFLFAGASGLGKTTLARIIARKFNCINTTNVLEIDGSTHTSIDDVRELQSSLKYGAIGDNPIKFIIIDECHMLSKAAWNALLKITEEPPEHVFFIFCTTELNKVPKAIKDQRCVSYNLKPVSSKDIADLLDYVVKEENLELEESAIDLIAREADGSPRRALNYLSKCRGCKDSKEVSQLLETFENESDVYNLCKLIISDRASWTKLIGIVKDLDLANYEGARIQIFNYLTTCVMNSKTEDSAARFLRLLNIFSKPLLFQQTSKGDFLLMLGDVVLGN